GRRGPGRDDDVRLEADQLLREGSIPIGVTASPTNIHSHVAAIGPTQVRKRSCERREAKRCLGMMLAARHDHADAPHAVALLRPRGQRPRCCRAAKRDYEFSPSDMNRHATLPRGVMPMKFIRTQ